MITPDLIIAMVAKRTGVSVADLLGRSRVGRLPVVRGVAMYLVRKDARDVMGEPFSYPVIGRIFHRDHATVINMACPKVGKIARRCRDNAAFAREVETMLTSNDALELLAVAEQVQAARQLYDLDIMDNSEGIGCRA